MRLINADRLNEVIERNICYPGCLKQIVDAQPTAYDVDKQWTPCSERLPEVFDNVLVCTKEGGRAIAHRCPNQASGRYYDLHSSAIDNVIAWQPLPEPYKEQDS